MAALARGARRHLRLTARRRRGGALLQGDEAQRLQPTARGLARGGRRRGQAILDAALRLGEALGLKWGQVAWGAGENDSGRALMIDRSHPRGGDEDLTKSGRARGVALSRRLRFALAQLYHARFKPGPEALIFAGIDPHNLRHREWRRILERAKIGHRTLKDLRDTFASQLLTAGVQLGYVSQQLGHADVAVTARHYARWAGGDEYHAPLTVAHGEVPSDFLARLASTTGAESHHSPTSDTAVCHDAIESDTGNASDFAEMIEGEYGDPGAIRRATPSFGGRVHNVGKFD